MFSPEKVRELVEKICPILAEQGPQVQGAVLADLLALWLFRHRVSGDKAATAAFREGLLEGHAERVRELMAQSGHAPQG